MKAVVAAFNQEKALVGAFSVITNLRMELFEALVLRCEERGKWGDHLLGILLGTHTGTGWVDKVYNVPVKVFMLNLIMLMKPGWSGEGDHKYW